MMLFCFVLVVLAGFVQCQSYTNCSAIPGVTSPTIDDYVKQSPYMFYWTLFGFDCATVVTSYPRVGFKNVYYGSSVITNSQNNQAVFFKLLNTNDTKAVHVFDCTAGCATPTTSVFNTIAFDDSKTGFYACHTVCDDDKFLNFLCITNSGDYINEMETVVNSVRGVPNGDKIHLAQANCPTCTQCQFLNI